MSEKVKTVLLFLFLFAVILTRIVLETAFFSQRYFFSYFVTLHHFCWYLFVVFYFFSCARYILGMKRESVKYLTLLSPVVMIPVVYAYLKGDKLHLAYLKGDIREVAFNVITLFKFHERNSEFFPEMVVLLTLFIAGSWFISKSVRRTLLNVFFGFFGAAMFAGLHLFGVFPGTKAYFKIHTVLRNHQLLALIYLGFSVIMFIIYAYPEINKVFLKDRFRYFLLVATGAAVSLISVNYGFEFFYGKPPMPADRFLLTIPFTVLSVSAFPLLGKSSNSFIAGKFFPLFFSLLSAFILAGIFAGIK